MVEQEWCHHYEVMSTKLTKDGPFNIYVEFTITETSGIDTTGCLVVNVTDVLPETLDSRLGIRGDLLVETTGRYIVGRTFVLSKTSAQYITEIRY